MDKDTITEWLTDDNTCFLIGAGCSHCAGKPLMAELTEKVVEKLTPKGKQMIDILNGPDADSKPTIEDVTNQLLRLQYVAAQRKDKKIDGWDLSKIEEEIQLIQKSIVEVIGTNWKSNDKHKIFLERLIQNSKSVRDIFLLNYDTVIEASIEDLKLPYVDGFRGTENAYFDAKSYDDKNMEKRFNIYKLHGSINWVRASDEIVRRKPLSTITDEEYRHVIYPAEQKYVQTQYGVYEVLQKLFRDRLKKDMPNNRLVVLGYSFSDDHITTAIEDGILSPGSNLTVFAFIGGNVSEARKEILKSMAEKCDNRFNVFVGQSEYIGTGLNKEECETNMKTIDFSRFENIVDFLAGHKHE